MFECGKCKHLEGEVQYLRNQVQTLTDRLIALASPTVYEQINHPNSPNASYFGDGNGDLYTAYDEFGQAVLVEKDLQLK